MGSRLAANGSEARLGALEPPGKLCARIQRRRDATVVYIVKGSADPRDRLSR